MQRYVRILSLYIIFFVVIPYSLYAYLYYDLHYLNEKIDLVGYVSLYVHAIAPLLFFVAFWLAKCKTVKERIIFILFGFIIPFGVIYLLAYLDYLKNFHPIT